MRNYNKFIINDKKEFYKLIEFLFIKLDMSFEEKGRILYSILEHLDEWE